MRSSNFTGFIYLFLSLSIFSCTRSEDNLEIPEEILGLKPVYLDTTKMDQFIFSSDPKILVAPGKIFISGKTLFVSDEGKGIHVIDNSDNKNPKKIAFINIPGNVDIAKKGNFLYADCNGYLITVDISDPLNVKVTGIANMIDQDRLSPPMEVRSKYFGNSRRVFYECPQNSKGLIMDWEVDTLYKPECYIGSNGGSFID